MASPSDEIIPFIPPKHRHHRLIPMPQNVESVPINDWQDEVGPVPIDRSSIYLGELATILRRLTYGEMMEFANGIGGDPAKINKWAHRS